MVYVGSEDADVPAKTGPKPELPNAVPDDIKEVVKNFRPIADEASGMLRTFLKKARLSLEMCIRDRPGTVPSFHFMGNSR